MVQNNQEYRLKYWVTRLSVRSFACSALLTSLALLARSTALIRSLARSFRSLSRMWGSELLDSYLFCVFLYSGPQCRHQPIFFSVSRWNSGLFFNSISSTFSLLRPLDSAQISRLLFSSFLSFFFSFFNVCSLSFHPLFHFPGFFEGAFF